MASDKRTVDAFRRIKNPDSLRRGASQAAGTAPTLRYGALRLDSPLGCGSGVWYGRKVPFRLRPKHE